VNTPDISRSGAVHPLSLEVRHHFAPALWQSAPLPPEPASTVLVTWTSAAESIDRDDGGMPPGVQVPFAAALCALGTVFYAADAEAQAIATQIVEVTVKQAFRRRQLSVFRACSAREVLPAFESGTNDWSMNAQWLVVAGPSGLETPSIESLARTLYQEWRLPIPWPESVLLLIQAGVDGDAAICHCMDRQIDEEFCTALRIAADEAGVGFEILDAEPNPDKPSSNESGRDEPVS
jgi:hypothetical protein